MNPILYPSTEKAFDTNGIGILGEAISCEVEWKENSIYEAVLKYPLDGLHAEHIKKHAIFLAKPAPDKEPQPFRIYRPVRNSDGTITAYARHIAYDLSGIPAAPFTASSVATAMSGLKSHAAVDCPFSFTAKKSASGSFSSTVPKSIWALIGSSDGGILSTYGGEYEFDRWSVTLHERLGADNGYSIRYAKNLQTLEQDENCASCFTGVYPYWADNDGNLVQLPEKIVRASGTYDYEQILPVDFSSDFEEAPSQTELRLKAQEYILANNVGVPQVSWKIEFVDLVQTEEYKDQKHLGTVSWGDTVHVVFPRLNIDATARVATAKYDSIREIYINITLGSLKTSIADTIAKQQKERQLQLIRQRLEFIDRLQKAEAEAAAKAEQAKQDAIDAAAKDAAEKAEQAEQNANDFAQDAADSAEKNAIDHAELLAGQSAAALEEYAQAVTSDLGALQNQIDGNITTWFYDGAPTTRNQPASGWTTTADKNAHLGDLYYDNQTGYCYRWRLSGSTYSWVRITDTDVTKALENAAAAQDTADSKRRVFTSQPRPPYDVGDLWAEGASGDLKICQTARASGSYRSSDWVLATKYIDEATAESVAETVAEVIAEEYVDLLDELLDREEIFSRLTNNGKIQGIYEENGNYYINASYIKTGSLSADLIKAGILLAEYVKLRGKFEVYNGSTLGGHLGYLSGSTTVDGGTITTNGIGLTNPSRDCMVITTTSGSRLQAGVHQIYVSKDGQAAISATTIKIGNKTVSWKSNGDGTYTLIGK